MRNLSDRDGVAGIALLAMYADGVVRGDEDDILRERLRNYAIFADVGDSELGIVLSDLERMSREEGTDRFLDECCVAVRDELASMALTIANDIIQADGEVAPEEVEFLERLTSKLQAQWQI